MDMGWIPARVKAARHRVALTHERAVAALSRLLEEWRETAISETKS
jgi:hypothetical protein